MTRLETLKQLDVHHFPMFFDNDCRNIFSFNIETNELMFMRYVDSGCGCCQHPEEFETNLDEFIDNMDQKEFDEFVEHLTYTKS